MRWMVCSRGDKTIMPLADRHYNRQKPGSPQFVPPGRCLVLRTVEADALWVTSFPFAQYVKHAWGGAWVCSLFRNESRHLSSELIREAVAATRAFYGPPPEVVTTPRSVGATSFVTFVDPMKTKRKRDPGRCYRKAGWRFVGHTKSGLVALALGPEDCAQVLHAIPAVPATRRAA